MLHKLKMTGIFKGGGVEFLAWLGFFRLGYGRGWRIREVSKWVLGRGVGSLI